MTISYAFLKITFFHLFIYIDGYEYDYITVSKIFIVEPNVTNPRSHVVVSKSRNHTKTIKLPISWQIQSI